MRPRHASIHASMHPCMHSFIHSSIHPSIHYVHRTTWATHHHIGLHASGASATRNLPTEIIPTKICWLKSSRKFPMDMIIPPLKLNIMLESNHLKSRILVWRLAGRQAATPEVRDPRFADRANTDAISFISKLFQITSIWKTHGINAEARNQPGLRRANYRGLETCKS